MVWQVYNAVKIPVIGMGGISNTQDAIEFILAGSSAIQIGTYNFINPTVSEEVVDGILDYMNRHNIDAISDLVGKLEC
jgi:dihydroorotate dehydrogenase (NAD+) catalytic subunit